MSGSDGDNVAAIHDRGGGCGTVEAGSAIGIREPDHFWGTRICDGRDGMAQSGRLARIPSSGFVGRFLCGIVYNVDKVRKTRASVRPFSVLKGRVAPNNSHHLVRCWSLRRRDLYRKCRRGHDRCRSSHLQMRAGM